MSRTISVSGLPKRLFRCFVAGFAVFFGLFLGGQAVLAVIGSLGVSASYPGGPTGIVLFAVLWVGLTALWVWRAGRLEESSSTWGPIPERQYTGRFAEAGGIARHNWEKAVRQLPGRVEDDD